VRKKEKDREREKEISRVKILSLPAVHSEPGGAKPPEMFASFASLLSCKKSSLQNSSHKASLSRPFLQQFPAETCILAKCVGMLQCLWRPFSDFDRFCIRIFKWELP
jgi:hypothetical protein